MCVYLYYISNMTICIAVMSDDISSGIPFCI